MKKTFMLLIIVSVFIACANGSKTELCKQKELKIIELNPLLKEMPIEQVKKMKENAISEENIKKCVAEFKQEAMDCLMKASNLTDMQKCK